MSPFSSIQAFRFGELVSCPRNSPVVPVIPIMTILAILAIFFIPIFVTSETRGASLERLADGRVIIHAFGERLAFREKDAGRIGFRWFYGHEQCVPHDGANLALWLNDPKVAECMNRVIPNDFPSDPLINLSIQVAVIFENGKLFPGAIDGSDIAEAWTYPDYLKEKGILSDFGRALAIGLGRGSANSGTGCMASKAVGSEDALGYRSYQISRSPPGYGYVLAGDRRYDNASRPLCIVCDWAKTCGVYLESGQKAVSFVLGWREWGSGGPIAMWTSYDRAAREIAHSIFIDRPHGDFQ